MSRQFLVRATEALGRVVRKEKAARKVRRKIFPGVFYQRSVTEISVQRLDLAPEVVSVGHALKTAADERFVGWVTILAGAAAQGGRSVVASPFPTNQYHADIVLQVDDEMAIKEQAQKLADRSKWREFIFPSSRDMGVEQASSQYHVSCNSEHPKDLRDSLRELQDAPRVATINKFQAPSSASMQCAEIVLHVLHDSICCPRIVFPTYDGKIAIAVAWKIEKSAFFICTDEERVTICVHTPAGIELECESAIEAFEEDLMRVSSALGSGEVED